MVSDGSPMTESNERGSSLAQDISDLIDRCLQPNPTRRPSAEEIFHFLQGSPLPGGYGTPVTGPGGSSNGSAKPEEEWLAAAAEALSNRSITLSSVASADVAGRGGSSSDAMERDGGAAAVDELFGGSGEQSLSQHGASEKHFGGGPPNSHGLQNVSPLAAAGAALGGMDKALVLLPRESPTTPRNPFEAAPPKNPFEEVLGSFQAPAAKPQPPA